jgi:hypothetical protein
VRLPALPAAPAAPRGHLELQVTHAYQQIEKSDPHFQHKYYVPSGHKTYAFEDGGPAAKIGDTFLDRTGEIYRASQPV